MSASVSDKRAISREKRVAVTAADVTAKKLSASITVIGDVVRQ